MAAMAVARPRAVARWGRDSLPAVQEGLQFALTIQAIESTPSVPLRTEPLLTVPDSAPRGHFP